MKEGVKLQQSGYMQIPFPEGQAPVLVWLPTI